MTTQEEFENTIRKNIKVIDLPSRESFARVLSSLSDLPVTKEPETRYTMQTATSNIINNKINEIMAIWRSKRIILIPTFLLLLFVGAFSLSSNTSSSSTLLRFVEKDEAILEPEVIDEDEILIEAFDTPGINDLSTIENEI